MGLSKSYAAVFSKGFLKKVNMRLLKYALGAHGYNLAGGENFHTSGESFFIENILAPTKPKLCIDVGANTGQYSKEILAKTSAKVIAFEPVPSTFSLLEKEFYGKHANLVLENKGVGDANGIMAIGAVRRIRTSLSLPANLGT